MTLREGNDGEPSWIEAGTSGATGMDPARRDRCDQERPRSTTAPPLDKERAKERAAALLFRPKVLRDVMHWLKRLGVPAHDRRDVASDVWLAAVASWPTYDPARARPKRWLNRITVHVASHYRARARHRREELVGELMMDVLDPAPGAPAVIDLEERRIGMLDALGALDRSSLELLLEHDLEGIPMAALAAQSGIPASTLYKRRARAIAALRAEIEHRRSPGDTT